MNEIINVNYTEETAKAKKKASGRFIAAALCCAVIGGGIGAGGTFIGMSKLMDSSTVQSEETASVPALSVVNTASVNSGSLMSASEVYEKNVGSTVGITTSVSTNYFGYQTMSAASGSGFIISEDGYILTNHHVIENANEITVTAYDGTQYQAKLVGSYAANDIAVLKIDAEGLTPVSVGTSGSLKVGEDVVAIGNPLGELTFSLTAGVVSALDREITTELGTMNLIQTDCAINSGNSGGALFNMHGEVVGITNAKYSSSSSGEASIDNIGFAIPIDQVKGMVESIIEKGCVVKPFIGVSVEDVSGEMTAYGLPRGAAVKKVEEGSPAEKAGLKANDIITKAGDTDITGSGSLVNFVRGLKKGDVINITVYRSGETKQIELTVDETEITADDGSSKEKTEEETVQDEELPFGGFEKFFGIR